MQALYERIAWHFVQVQSDLRRRASTVQSQAGSQVGATRFAQAGTPHTRTKSTASVAGKGVLAAGAPVQGSPTATNSESAKGWSKGARVLLRAPADHQPLVASVRLLRNLPVTLPSM